MVFFSVVSFSFIPNINSFVRGSLPPLIIILSLFLSIIMTYLSSKIAKHPLSQNDPIDTNACFKSKKIWSFLASKGIYLLGNLPIYVDLMISSAGNFTSIGIIAFFIFITFDPLGMKLTVVPEYSIAFIISNFPRLPMVDASSVTWISPYFHLLYLIHIPRTISSTIYSYRCHSLYRHGSRLWHDLPGVWNIGGFCGFFFHPHDQHYPSSVIALGWIHPLPGSSSFPLLFPLPLRPPCWWFRPFYWYFLWLYHLPCQLLFLE